MNKFYNLFPKVNPVSSQLSWTFTSEYKLYFPTEEKLQIELSKEIALLEGGLFE